MPEYEPLDYEDVDIASLAGRQGPKGDKGDQGLPGVNAVPADEAIAAYMAATGTHTRTALETWAETGGEADVPGLISADDRARAREGLPVGDRDLNTVLEPGLHRSFTVAYVTRANNYPVAASSCWLRVVQYDSDATRFMQELTYNVNGRRFTRITTDGGVTWSKWQEYARLVDAEAAARDYSTPYEYELPITYPDIFRMGEDPLRVTRVGDMISLGGSVEFRANGTANTSEWVTVAVMPPDAVPFSGNRGFDGSTNSGSYSLRITGTGRLQVARHSTGAADALVTFGCVVYPTGPKPAGYFDRFMAKFYEGDEYAVNSRIGAVPRFASITIHGGEIEPAPSEVAAALRDRLNCSWYEFDALKTPFRGASAFAQIHASSNGWDDPRALAIVNAADYVISWHGAADTTAGAGNAVSFVGGMDTELGSRIAYRLREAGFTVWDNPDDFPNLGGRGETNICQQTRRGVGVQIEMSATLRRSFFPGGDLSRSVRKSGARTATFTAYLAAVETAVREVVGI